MLYSAETVGAIVATGLSGWTARVHHHGRAIVIAAALYGACIAAAGLSPSIWLAVLFFTLAGASDMISAVFRGTIWNQTIPDNLRGRLAGIEMLSYSVGPLAGQVRAGIVADRWSVRGSIISGGLSCVAGVTITAMWLHDFWRYDSRTDEHALAQREARQLAGERRRPLTRSLPPPRSGADSGREGVRRQCEVEHGVHAHDGVRRDRRPCWARSTRPRTGPWARRRPTGSGARG